MEARESRVEKNGAKKSRKLGGEPMGQCFTGPVSNGRGRSLLLIGARKLLFFCPIKGQHTLESFRVFLLNTT